MLYLNSKFIGEIALMTENKNKMSNNIEETGQNENLTTILNKKEKKRVFYRILLTILIFILISAALVCAALLWQWRFDFLSITNAFYFSGIILFSIGFFVYAANNNVFSSLVYGTKTFFLMFSGKKPKLGYYEYTQEIKENPIPKLLVSLPLLASVPNLIIAIILHVIFNLYIF